ncbi:MAG: arginine decarboxylase, pyruvoyl-dependent [Methanobrevibacter sp.]|nr:arginine decarboxylase, pyruvoyl-dependent [Candidatus Methanovirga aequatorialis]
MKISIVSGKKEGPTKLNAFDNALIEAGIGDQNLIKVSSMLDGKTEIVDLPVFKPGEMINCVLSSICSDEPGDKLFSSIGIAIGEELGCVVEKSGINLDTDESLKEVDEMVRYMMEVRGVEIKHLHIEYSEHIVQNIGSTVVSVVYVEH